MSGARAGVGFAAIVPVIDEAETIADVVTDLRRHGACCVIVVDGLSSDRTPENARAAGATVVTEARRGYGRACRTGAAHAVHGGATGHEHAALAFLDGDGSCAGEDVARLVAALATADVALGVRPADRLEAGAMPWHARIGNVLVASLLSVRSGRRVRDLPPAKAIRAGVLHRLDLDADGYGWTVQVVARSCMDPTVRIRQIPVAFRRRRGGRSKVSGSVRASAAAAAAMVRTTILATRPRPVLVLMAKAPAAGHAKTRLATDLGDAATAALWTAILADAAASARAASSAARAATLVMLPRGEDVEPVERIVGAGWAPIVQGRPGLAAALSDAFLAAFDRGTDRAVAVAGDAPLLPPEDIATGFDLLRSRRSTAVLGPSLDGGYNLIGLRWPAAPLWWPRAVRRRRRRALERRLRHVFDGALGGSAALRSTSDRLAQAGWTVGHLAERPDIDTVGDLAALRDAVAADTTVARQTEAWLTEHAALVEARASAARRSAEPSGVA